MIINKMQRRVRISGALVLLGLLVELASLLWATPTAFFFFMPGALLIAAGILLYLYSLVSVADASSTEDVQA